ncbi:hypothetical protein CDAR_498881 [Caerostris darwini]|uniref:Uncharacterized protein n=1 Tax=Caerostris darwini TaxID=1538125 RepID=A0AAV4SPK4_9ARAC|nr:hypothetical protein CDAR_498881 [Caerostris darwini]
MEHISLPSAKACCSSHQPTDVPGHVMSDFIISRSPGFCSLSSVVHRHQACPGLHVLTVKPRTLSDVCEEDDKEHCSRMMSNLNLLVNKLKNVRLPERLYRR